MCTLINDFFSDFLATVYELLSSALMFQNTVFATNSYIIFLVFLTL